VADAGWGILAGDGDFEDGGADPGGSGDDFGFEAVAAGTDAKALHQVEGIDAEAALAVGDSGAGLPTDGEVGEAAAEAIFCGVAVDGFGAGAEDEGGGVGARRVEERGEVGGIVLAIGVDGGGVGVAGGAGSIEAGEEGGGFAAVDVVVDGAGAVREDFSGGIGGAVVDDHEWKAQRLDALDHLAECSGVVVGRGEDDGAVHDFRSPPRRRRGVVRRVPRLGGARPRG